MATSTQVRDTLKARLKGKAGISSQEDCNPFLDDFLDESLVEHSVAFSPGNVPDFTLLPFRQYELVLLLGWIRVCEYRASSAAPQPSLRAFGPGSQAGAGFGGDRDTPFKKNMELAAYLRKKYDDLKTRLDDQQDEQGSGDITIGELYRQDELTDAAVPWRSSPLLNAPQLTLETVTGVAAGGASLGIATFAWTAVSSEYFSQLYLVRNALPDIQQMWNQDGVNGVPFVNTGTVSVYDTTDNIAKGARETMLAAGTYYYIIAMRDTSAQWTFSNEVKAIVPA